jgi:membrane dipeptidase
MERNHLGDGCLEPENRGLTHFGIQVIRECNRIGILIDCSHVGIRTTLDAAEHSGKPIVISHAAVRAIADNPRGVTDEMMKAVAKSGGVIGFIPLGPLIRLDRPATLSDYLDHFDHALNLLMTQPEYAFRLQGLNFLHLVFLHRKIHQIYLYHLVALAHSHSLLP